MRTMVERWIAFVVDEGKTNKKKIKKGRRHSNLSCTLVGRREEGEELKPLTRDRCMHMWYVGAPLLPEQIDSVLHVHRAIQITVHQAAYSRRYGTPLKLARKDYRRISFRLFRERRSFMGENDDRPFQLLNINRSSEIVFCYLLYWFIFLFFSWMMNRSRQMYHSRCINQGRRF